VKKNGKFHKHCRDRQYYLLTTSTYDGGSAYLHAIKPLSVSITRTLTVWQAWRAAIYKIRLRYRVPMRFYLSLVSCFDGKSRKKKKERKRRKEKVIGNIRAAAPFVPRTNFSATRASFFSTCRRNVIEYWKLVCG